MIGMDLLGHLGGGGETTGAGYGASPFCGLTGDVAGMGIKG